MGLFGSPEVDTTYQDFQMAEAERRRAEEEARQARIDEGMRHIAAIFEGGDFTTPAVYETVTTQENLPPEWRYTGPQYGDIARVAKERLEKNQLQYADMYQKMGLWDLVSGTGPDVTEERLVSPEETKTYEGMQPFLDQRRQAMEDYYTPQLDEQKADAEKELTFALARAGLLNSTVADEKQADLSQRFGLESGSILSKIASDIAGQKTRMNQQRASIEAALRASGDQSAAANQALQAAVTFREDAPEMNPLGHLFYGLSEGIGAARNGAEIAKTREALRAKSPFSGSAGRTVM